MSTLLFKVRSIEISTYSSIHLHQIISFADVHVSIMPPQKTLICIIDYGQAFSAYLLKFWVIRGSPNLELLYI